MAIPHGYELVVLLPLDFLPSQPPINAFRPPGRALDMADLTTNELMAVQQLVQLSGEADPKSPRRAAESSSSSSSSSVSPSIRGARRGRKDVVNARSTTRPARKRKYRSISHIYNVTSPVAPDRE